MEITRLSQLNPDGVYNYADYLSWKFMEDKNIIKYVLNKEGRFIDYCPITEEEIFHSMLFPELGIVLKEIFKD